MNTFCLRAPVCVAFVDIEPERERVCVCVRYRSIFNNIYLKIQIITTFFSFFLLSFLPKKTNIYLCKVVKYKLFFNELIKTRFLIYEEALSDLAQTCSDQGNQYPFCSPVSTDVWTNGSTYDFVWNFKYVTSKFIIL